MDALHEHRAPSSAAQTGVWVGIATISMSFAAYTSAMIVRQGAGADWQHFRLPPILYLNTLILLASSATFEIGRRQMAHRRIARASTVEPLSAATPAERRWLLLTLVLGLAFLAGQLLAWRSLAHQGFYLASNPSSSFFYIFTALHALHLLGGLGAIVYAMRLTRRPVTAAGAGALDAIGLYWHFMGVLWCYLLFILLIRL